MPLDLRKQARLLMSEGCAPQIISTAVDQSIAETVFDLYGMMGSC
jgi:hypothetical protein